jgi:hypothetical protein
MTELERSLEIELLSGRSPPVDENLFSGKETKKKQRLLAMTRIGSCHPISGIQMNGVCSNHGYTNITHNSNGRAFAWRRRLLVWQTSLIRM